MVRYGKRTRSSCTERMSYMRGIMAQAYYRTADNCMKGAELPIKEKDKPAHIWSRQVSTAELLLLRSSLRLGYRTPCRRPAEVDILSRFAVYMYVCVYTYMYTFIYTCTE